MIPSLCYYFIWSSIYTVWLFTSGRFNSKEMTGHDTLYHWSLSVNKSYARLIGYNVHDKTGIVPVLKYQFGHFI